MAAATVEKHLLVHTAPVAPWPKNVRKLVELVESMGCGVAKTTSSVLPKATVHVHRTAERLQPQPARREVTTTEWPSGYASTIPTITHPSHVIFTPSA